jgi:hypothetical protein
MLFSVCQEIPLFKGVFSGFGWLFTENTEKTPQNQEI